MKNLLWLLVMGLLAACGSGGAVEGETAVTSSTTTTSTAVPEPVESDTNAPTSTGDAASPIIHYPIAGTVTEAAEIRETDWAKGAAEPLVSIIEYGDFQ